jgi:hypothetical protein
LSRTSRKVILPDGRKAIETDIAIGKGAKARHIFEYTTRWKKFPILTIGYPKDSMGRIYDLIPDGSRVEQLDHALRESSQCLDDWIVTYASEFCNQDQIKATGRRVRNGGGTLAYIADQVAKNKDLLEKK